jgi:translation initiation factor 2B subunit (eIF-2B alpha/beta/delta family)
MAQMTPELAARVAAIGADNQSGATAIAAEAVLVLQEARLVDVSVVPVVATALCKAQPAMASVWNAAALSLRSDGEEALSRFGGLLRRAPDALARVAVELLLAGREDGQTFSVVTVSASGSVRECLLLLSRRCRLRVLCAEGRPLLEGRVLATSLAAAGITTTVSTDAAVTSLGAKFDAVLVGADAVAAGWFLNKCGTHQVVEVAATHGIPAYVAASRDKFVDPTLARMLVPTGGTDAEVWAEHPPEVEVANPYFERVPVQSLVGVITDAGLVGPGSLGDVAAGLVGQDDVGRLIGQLRRP